MQNEKPWTAKKFANRYDLSVLTVYRLIREGKLPAIRLGRKVFISHSVIEAMETAPRGEMERLMTSKSQRAESE